MTLLLLGDQDMPEPDSDDSALLAAPQTQSIDAQLLPSRDRMLQPYVCSVGLGGERTVSFLGQYAIGARRRLRSSCARMSANRRFFVASLSTADV